MDKLKTLIQVAANAYWEYKPLWTTRRLTTSLEDIPIDRPIFVLGVQGGGLTLLTRMIHRHRDIVTIGGGRRYWVGNNEMDKQYIGDLPEAFTLRAPRFQSPTFKTHMRGDEYQHPVFGAYRCWVYACDDLLPRYRKAEADWTPKRERRLRQAIKESIRTYAPDPSSARFLDMSQTFTLKIPLLRKIFPDAQFIVQSRNPYAVCLKEARDESYEWRRKASMATKLWLFSEHWANTYRCALEDLEDVEEALFIRYEDLVQFPEETLKQVLDVAELGFDEDMLPRPHHRLPLGASEGHKWYPIRTGVNKKHLEKLENGQISIIKENVQQIAGRLGYDPPEK